jgi:asparagine synthase (glutamine-hydrolysing)
LTRKVLLKKVAKAWLPPEIIQRSKKGFPIPISAWMRGEARTYVRDVLSPVRLSQRGLFQPTFVERLLDEHETGFADHGSLIWGLLSVELWYRLYIDAARPTFSQTPAINTTVLNAG